MKKKKPPGKAAPKQAPQQTLPPDRALGRAVRFKGMSVDDLGGIEVLFDIAGEPTIGARVSVTDRDIACGLHVSQGVEYDGPTTGSAALDAELAEKAVEEVRRVRAVEVLAAHDRGHR